MKLINNYNNMQFSNKQKKIEKLLTSMLLLNYLEKRAVAKSYISITIIDRFTILFILELLISKK